MGINQIPGVGPTNADIATAVAAPSAATIATAVAAAVPTNSSIASAVGTSFNPLAMTAQQTFNTSSNNVTVSGKNWVYALVIGGGGGGGSGVGSGVGSGAGGGAGGIAFGLTPVTSVVTVGAGGSGSGTTNSNNTMNANAGGNSRYGWIQATGGTARGYALTASTSGWTFGSAIANYAASMSGIAGNWPIGDTFVGTSGSYGSIGWEIYHQYGSIAGRLTNSMAGGAGINNVPTQLNFIGAGGGGNAGITNNGTAGIASANYAGGTRGAPVGGVTGGGGGGGGGWLAAGTAGNSGSGTVTGNGGAGGAGGGGGGGGGGHDSSAITGGGQGGAGGAGCVILYY